MHKVWELLFPLAMPFWSFAEGDPVPGPAPDPDPEPEPDPEPDPEPEPEPPDADALKTELAKAKAALKKANAEAKERRLKLKKFEEEEAERAKAKLTELEKAQADLQEAAAKRDQLQQINIDLTIRHAIELGAMKLGFLDPVDAFNLIDVGEIEVDEDTGEVSGVEKALKALAKAKPYLLGEETPSHGTPSAKGRKKSTAKGKLPERSMVHM